MTNSKAYNLRIYCKLVNKEHDSEEGQLFLKKTILEQLTIIKDIRDTVKRQTATAEPEGSDGYDFSIMNSIFKKIN